MMTEAEKNKYDFSVTFWIKAQKNPGWMNSDSEINFPPFTVKQGIMVFFCKIRENLKIYLLHPDLGYRKLTSKITNYLGKDTFVALTNTESETSLYLNADLVKKIEKKDLINDLEVGDYVMVNVKNGDLQNVQIGKGDTILMPAKIKTLSKENAQLEFFQAIGKEIQVVKLPKERIQS
jgi:hypothetical protein